MAVCAVIWSRGQRVGQGLTDNPVLEATMFFNWRYQLFSAFKFDKFNLKESNVVLLGRGGPLNKGAGGQICFQAYLNIIFTCQCLHS